VGRTAVGDARVVIGIIDSRPGGVFVYPAEGAGIAIGPKVTAAARDQNPGVPGGITHGVDIVGLPGCPAILGKKAGYVCGKGRCGIVDIGVVGKINVLVVRAGGAGPGDQTRLEKPALHRNEVGLDRPYPPIGDAGRPLIFTGGLSRVPHFQIQPLGGIRPGHGGVAGSVKGGVGWVVGAIASADALYPQNEDSEARRRVRRDLDIQRDVVPGRNCPFRIAAADVTAPEIIRGISVIRCGSIGPLEVGDIHLDQGTIQGGTGDVRGKSHHVVRRLPRRRLDLKTDRDGRTGRYRGRYVQVSQGNRRMDARG
jgi:hypothetical protein